MSDSNENILYKAFISLFLLIAGGMITYYFNNRTKMSERKAAALAEYTRLRRESSLGIIDRQIAFQEQRLEQLLWPLTLCLRIDSTVWKKIPGLNVNSTMPIEAGSVLEFQLILPNHYKAVEIIEKNFHFVANEEKLLRPMIDYVQHVAVYRALRDAKVDANPIDVDAQFPSALPKIVNDVLTVSLAELAEKKASRAELISALGVQA